MHALITGVGGFLGQYMLAACESSGLGVHGLSRGSTRPRGNFVSYTTANLESTDLDKLLRAYPIDYCFHFASASNVAASVQSPLSDFSESLPGAARLFDSVRRNRPSCHIVISSSAAVYGNPESLPISESASVKPLSPYGIHKLLIEEMARHHCRIYGTRISSMRIFSAYGAGLRKQLLWDACCKGLAAARAGERTVEFFGTGEESRDFIHARDVSAAALAIAKSEGTGFTVYNVASGRETRVAQVAELLLRSLPGDLKPRFNGQERRGDPKRWLANVGRVQSLGFVPTASFESELEAYALWAMEEFQGQGA